MYQLTDEQYWELQKTVQMLNFGKSLARLNYASADRNVEMPREALIAYLDAIAARIDAMLENDAWVPDAL